MKWFQPDSLSSNQWLKKLDLKKYEQQGVDLSLLLSSLRSTPTERVENNKAMLLLVEEVRKNKKKAKHALS